MDKIKAMLHGTSVEHEKEVKEEKKAEKIEAKEEKKAEKHASHSNTGEGSHLAKGPHSETQPPAIDSTHTHDTTHRPKYDDPEAAGVSTLPGVNVHPHGTDSTSRPHEAGLVGNNTREPLSSHNAGVPANTTSGLGGVTSIPSGNELNTHGRDNTGSHGNSHLGRDAALGSGAVGAAGLAGHEHHKHAEGSHGTHNSAALNAADPRVDSDLDGNRLPNKTSSGYGTKDAYGTNTTGSSGHHLGRDAAAVGTAGAVGEGIHHHNNQHTQGGLGGIGGPHSTATANRLDPHLDGSAVRTEGAHTHHGHGAQSEGRVEGGGAEEADGVHGAKGTSAAAGVVPVGAYEAGHGHNTTVGPHSSNLANKADPRVDSDLSKQQNHHYGRDAAVAGGVGGAAYEADKHHHNKTTAGPHSSNLENKADPRVDSDRSKEQHHYGRDAAVAGGVGGAAYEANKHHNTHDQKSVGKDIGDKLHGVERNRGVNGPTGFPHESGHSVPTGAVGTGVPGAPRGNVQDNHNASNIEHPVHNSAKGPDHVFTAPVMDDPRANSELREGKIDQHDHHHGKGLEHQVNSAPLGNTSTTPGSDLRDNTYNTSSGHGGHHNNLTGHNTASTGTTGLTHESGLAGNNTSGLNRESDLTGYNTTGLNHGSTGTSGLKHESGLTGHNTTGLNHGSTGQSGTYGLTSENIGETEEFGNKANSRVL